MESRRRFLGTTALAVTGLLAGCSSRGGGSGTYPAGVPASAAFPDYTLRFAERYDLATIRDHAGVVHPDCGDLGIGCTPLRNEALVGHALVLDVTEVGTVVAGGAHEFNAYPRTLVSRTGSYLFKIYEYTADAGAVESRLADRYTATSTRNGFQLYRNEYDEIFADDGSRLVVAPDGVIGGVVDRLAGEHESFVAADAARGTVRDHLGSTTAEFVGVPDEPREEDPDWYADRTAIGEGVKVTGAGATYRGATVFTSQDALAAVSDDDVRAWADDAFQPLTVEERLATPTVDIQRSGRTLLLSATTDQYVGLF